MANFSNTVTNTQSSKPQDNLSNGYLGGQASPSGLINSYLHPQTQIQTTTPAIPKPSTPLKSQTTNADGSTKTEYHAPVAPKTSPAPASSQIQTPPPIAQPIPQATNAPATPIPPGYANPLIQPAIQANQQAVNINQALNQAVNDRTKQGIALPFVQGQQAALQRDYGVQAQAATQEAQNATNLAQFGQPQQYSLLSQPYNPLTDTYGGGGKNGAIDRSIQASNIGSAGDFQQKIQNTQATANAADANFSVLNSYAQGFAGDTPIVNGLSQLYGTTVQGNEAISGFKSQLQNVRAAYQAITGGDPVAAIPDNITPNQLKQVQESLKTTAANNVTGYKNQLGQLQSGTSTSSSGGGTDPLGIL